MSLALTLLVFVLLAAGLVWLATVNLFAALLFAWPTYYAFNKLCRVIDRLD
jgi:hypothetical protein